MVMHIVNLRMIILRRKRPQIWSQWTGLTEKSSFVVSVGLIPGTLSIKELTLGNMTIKGWRCIYVLVLYWFFEIASLSLLLSLHYTQCDVLILFMI